MELLLRGRYTLFNGIQIVNKSVLDKCKDIFRSVFEFAILKYVHKLNLTLP